MSLNELHGLSLASVAVCFPMSVLLYKHFFPGPDVQALPDAESVPQNDSVVFTPAERPVAWCRAEEVCQDNGGHLVVIPNHHIESLVLKVVHEDVWIGGHIPRQPWTTVKGEIFSITNRTCLNG